MIVDILGWAATPFRLSNIVFTARRTPFSCTFCVGKNAGERRTIKSVNYAITAPFRTPFFSENIHNSMIVGILVRAATPFRLSNIVFTARRPLAHLRCFHYTFYLVDI